MLGLKVVDLQKKKKPVTVLNLIFRLNPTFILPLMYKHSFAPSMAVSSSSSTADTEDADGPAEILLPQDMLKEFPAINVCGEPDSFWPVFPHVELAHDLVRRYVSSHG